MLILALALLGAKLDDPKPVLASKLADPPPWSARVLPVTLRTDPKPEPKEPDVPPPAPVPPKPPAARPQMWQLTDRSGQRWQHADPNSLRQWVAQRNAAMVPQYTAPVLQFGSPCSNGSCPR